MSDDRFDLDGLPTRVLFGAGRRADVPGEVARLGGRRVLILTGRSQEVHSAVLPQVAALVAGAAPDALRRVARALGADDGADALHQLAVRAGAATSLGALGLREDQVDGVAGRVAAAAPAAPREVSAEDVRGVLRAALAGRG
ncbi:iron-containing alcohol dehydrogenase [Modestobacter sp. VKM Ac-2985]|uniref:iron-containing alcohol dehydrogenase n=1 Tax=Modestobacter sp. VKM Ac-2985 TaxID=3004139 RepID=UPI0022AB6561|nr:iron-containing alcohol dehydrogenase [Modestobacter sp. VKM Ac-2985]MCZ2836715.1 iron-containing alcohol dehydrogenase [Modestobacter sp. VKM Ac-2985]